MLDVGRLSHGARAILGRDLTESEVSAFQAYFSLLRRWQTVHRLVGSTEPRWVVDHVLLDSLLFSSFLPSPGCQVLDFGSGAGIPGVPLEITHPGLRLTLLEPRRRRASFLSEVLRTLGLPNARVVPSRSGAALAGRPELRGGFDVVLARCAGPPVTHVAEARPFLRPDGRIVISGPPRPIATDEGTWYEREHPTLARARRFLVVATQSVPRETSGPAREDRST
jgi:16S rRNA (guanine527-N7)-methyltransferase